MNAPVAFQGTALQIQMMNSFQMNTVVHNMNPEFRLTQSMTSSGTASTSNTMRKDGSFIAENINPRNVNLHGMVKQISPPLKDTKSTNISQNHISLNDKLQDVHSYGHTDATSASHLKSKNVPNTPQYGEVLENDLQSRDRNWKNGVPFSTSLNVSWHLSMQENGACLNASARAMGSENRGLNATAPCRLFNENPLHVTTSKKIPDLEVRERAAIKENLPPANRQKTNPIDTITKTESRPYTMPFKKRLTAIYQQTAEEQATSLNDTTPQGINFVDAPQGNSLHNTPLNLKTFKTFQQPLTSAKTASYDAISQITTLPDSLPTNAFNESPLNLTTVKKFHQQHLSATHREEIPFSPREEERKSLPVRLAPNKETLDNAIPFRKRPRDIDTHVATKEDAIVGDPFKIHRTPLKATAATSFNVVNEKSESLSNFIQSPKSKPVLIEERANEAKCNALPPEAEEGQSLPLYNGPSCSKRQRDVTIKKPAVASDGLTSPRVPLKAVNKNCSNVINENHEYLSNPTQSLKREAVSIESDANTTLCKHSPTQSLKREAVSIESDANTTLCKHSPTQSLKREAVSIENDANTTLCKQFDDMNIGTIEIMLQNLEAWHCTRMRDYQSLKANEIQLAQIVEEKNRLEQKLLSNGRKINETDFEKFLLKKMEKLPDMWPSRQSSQRRSVDSDKQINPTEAGFSSQPKRLENYLPENWAGLPESFVADENGMVVIGPNGTKIAKEQLMSIKWNSSGPAITRKILMALFDRSTLASANLSGKPSPAFIDVGKPLKCQLDPLKVADVTHFMTKCTRMTVREVRLSITTKCADENKMLRIQNKKKDCGESEI
uniref:BEN domain-containing protein n=1 Tax=Glossina morsitans morsitans TaxID=37546 RepID=A0A1B0FR20_GLOMM